MEKSLYDRLGGAEKIATIIDDIVEAHMNNPAIKARFLPYRDKPDDLATVKGHLRAFLCAGSGGPQRYSGRAMTDAHRGMNINGDEYLAAIDDIMAALAKNGIDEPTRKDVLAIVYSLKGEIMQV